MGRNTHLAEEKVQRSPNYGDCGQLADPVLSRRDRGRKDVCRQLQFKRKRKVARERQANQNETASPPGQHVSR